MDEEVIADAAYRIGRVAVYLHLHDQPEPARALAEQVKRLQRQLQLQRPPETPCARCGRPVPDVPRGRPRKFCEVCRRPRTKVRDFGQPLERVEV